MSFKVVMVHEPTQIPEDFPERVRRTGVEFSLHTSCKTEDELLSMCRDADYIMTRVAKYPFTPRVLRQLGKCRFIQTLGVGYDAIDVNVATEQGIGVIHLRGFCTEELAEHAMALMLACSRWIMVLHSRIKMGKPVVPASAEAIRHMSILRRKTLGLVGFGNAGRAMVPKAKSFGMSILAYDPYVDKGLFEELNVEKVTLDRLLEESDFISIHANLTPENRHLIGLEQFKKMKRSAFIINTARGAILDERALYTALSDGYIAGAGLDVTDPEPLPVDSPLLNFDNVILTGHNAGSSPESQAAMWTVPIEELSRVMHGEWPFGLVNPEVKEKYTAKWGEMRQRR
jgi:D-3-phosphoglycerate dehydrogenase